jgi:ubiquinol-cytochrome c reductase iron-sulfur subunit
LAIGDFGGKSQEGQIPVCNARQERYQRRKSNDLGDGCRGFPSLSADKALKLGAQVESRAEIIIMATVTDDTPNAGIEDGGVRRRDFINVAAASFAGVGAVAIVAPLIYQMNPSADVLAEASIEVDLAAIGEGQAVKTMFRKQPLFIRHLTAAEIAAADKVDVSSLRDPETLEQRTKEGKKQWLVTMGVCTHLGCVPLGASEGEVKGEFGGYFCPCHGSNYDTAARIRKGPAPKNLLVPEYAFKSDTVIQVG